MMILLLISKEENDKNDKDDKDDKDDKPIFLVENDNYITS